MDCVNVFNPRSCNNVGRKRIAPQPIVVDRRSNTIRKKIVIVLITMLANEITSCAETMPTLNDNNTTFRCSTTHNVPSWLHDPASTELKFPHKPLFIEKVLSVPDDEPSSLPSVTLLPLRGGCFAPRVEGGSKTEHSLDGDPRRRAWFDRPREGNKWRWTSNAKDNAVKMSSQGRARFP